MQRAVVPTFQVDEQRVLVVTLGYIPVLVVGTTQDVLFLLSRSVHERRKGRGCVLTRPTDERMAVVPNMLMMMRIRWVC